MAEERNIRIEDDKGNTYYPHTKASNVKANDGKTVEEKFTEVNENIKNSGKIGTKEVDETGFSNDFDKYELEFDKKQDKWKVKPSTRPMIYGVVIDESNSNPETAVTYINDAVGFTPMKGNNGNFQWGSWKDTFPINQIKPCVFKDGKVNYYLNPNDYTKKIDGTTADITSGNDGDVMVEFPKLYWKMWKVGTEQYVQFSDKYFDGAKCPAHTVGTTVKDKIYLSAYLGILQDDKLRSLSGGEPQAYKVVSLFRTSTQANGKGYQLFTYYSLLMLQILYIVWFKNRDSQSALGVGRAKFGGTDNKTIGATNQAGMFYGTTREGTRVKFAGIEDFYGYYYYHIDGFYLDSNNILISNQDEFNSTGSGYINHGQSVIKGGGGYIDAIHGTTEIGFVAKSINGSGTTHYCDYSSFLNKLAVAGGANSSDRKFDNGVFGLEIDWEDGDKSSAIGARTCFIGA